MLYDEQPPAGGYSIIHCYTCIVCILGIGVYEECSKSSSAPISAPTCIAFGPNPGAPSPLRTRLPFFANPSSGHRALTAWRHLSCPPPPRIVLSLPCLSCGVPRRAGRPRLARPHARAGPPTAPSTKPRRRPVSDVSIPTLSPCVRV